MFLYVFFIEIYTNNPFALFLDLFLHCFSNGLNYLCLVFWRKVKVAYGIH